MNQSHSSSTPKIVNTIVISAILLIGIYTFLTTKNPNSLSSSVNLQASNTASDTSASAASSLTTSNPLQQTSATQSSQASSSSAYKNGNYSKTVSYQVPGGSINQLSVEISLSDDSITSIKASGQYTDRESSFYVSSFNSEIGGAVKGKN